MWSIDLGMGLLRGTGKLYHNRRRSRCDEVGENLERWLVSYADFITLLFAFFVTMYAISMVDGKKLGFVVESLQRALGSGVAVQVYRRDSGVFSSDFTSVEGYLSTVEARAFEKLVEEIKEGLDGISKGNAQGFNQGQIKFILEKRGLVIRVSEHLFFRSGDASIQPEFIPLLEVLGKAFERIPNHIRIEGHTDNVPINTPRFPSNWELSTARATAIVRYFLTHFDFDPDRLSATGYAEFYPIDTNETPEGRSQNRRVDFVVLCEREMGLGPVGVR